MIYYLFDNTIFSKASKSPGRIGMDPKLIYLLDSDPKFWKAWIRGSGSKRIFADPQFTGFKGNGYPVISPSISSPPRILCVGRLAQDAQPLPNAAGVRKKYRNRKEFSPICTVSYTGWGGGGGYRKLARGGKEN
jgi:hypothetical protein